MVSIDYDHDTNTLYAIVVGIVVAVILCIACIIYGIVRSGIDVCVCFKNVLVFPCTLAGYCVECCRSSSSG